jgi:hypothetical protein
MNLVHPSMYPFVAGKSKAIDNNNNNNNNSTVDNNNDATTFVNEHIQGLSLRTRVKAGLRPPPIPKSKTQERMDDKDTEDDEQYSSDHESTNGGYPLIDTSHITKQVLGRRYEDSMYQWMPAEFAVAKDGSVDIKSSYEL